MSIIHENPFRVLGLMSNSSERELQKKIGIVKRYIDVGKHVEFDTDYSFLPKVMRSGEVIQVATGKIEQNHKKRHYALFWFVNSSPFDEIAFSKLGEDNIQGAIDIWGKTLKSSVTSNNFSSYLNLSSLYAALASKSSNIDLHYLKKSLALKSIILNRENLERLTELVCTKADIIDTDQISMDFADEIYHWLKPILIDKQGISVDEFIALFEDFSEPLRNFITGKFTEIPASNIETQIEKTKLKRSESPQNADEYGESLYKSTITDLRQINSVLGQSDVQTQILTEKLAAEILQCSIVYFNYHRDENESFDPGDNALRVIRLADSIGAGGNTADRISDNLEFITEWVEEKEDRERFEDVKAEIAFITRAIEEFKKKNCSIVNSRLLIQSTRPELASIRHSLGSSDEMYIMLCDGIYSNALGMIVDALNHVQENMGTLGLDSMLQSFSSARSILNEMLASDISRDLKQRVRINLRTIASIDDQLNAAKKKQNSACYIATMAYGDCDHPQVQILRDFRDETLSKTYPGRLFISTYYALSPSLVRILKGHKSTNKAIRSILNCLIRKLKS